MKEKILDKLKHVNELISRGATEGEKEAAKLAFERLVKKYDIQEDDLLEILEKEYIFKFGNYAEYVLLVNLTCIIKDVFLDELETWKYSGQEGQRKLIVKLSKLEYIELSAMYEYFRKHMKPQRKEVVETTKYYCRFKNLKYTKEVRAAQRIFIWEYVRRSNICAKTRKEGTTTRSSVPASVFNSIEGGEYFKQMNSDSRLLATDI